MKTKNNSKKVEKNYSYSVVDIALVAEDPLKYYRKNFCFNAPVITRVFINPVSMNNYSFGKVSTRKGYIVLSKCVDLHIHDLFKHNRNLIQYQPNINSL